jgi:hypothetical protein
MRRATEIIAGLLLAPFAFAWAVGSAYAVYVALAIGRDLFASGATPPMTWASRVSTGGLYAGTTAVASLFLLQAFRFIRGTNKKTLASRTT